MFPLGQATNNLPSLWIAIPSGRSHSLLRIVAILLSGVILRTRPSRTELIKRLPSRSNAGPSRTYPSGPICSHGSAIIVRIFSSSGGKGISLFTGFILTLIYSVSQLMKLLYFSTFLEFRWPGGSNSSKSNPIMWYPNWGLVRCIMLF